MSVVIDDKVVGSEVQDLHIPECGVGPFLKEAFVKFRDRIALIDDATGTVYTYEQFDGHVSRVTAGLRQLGLCPGDTVGFHSDVSIDLFFGFYGTIFAGGCVVFAKANLRKREVEYQFRDSKPSIVFCDEKNADKAFAACKEVPSVKHLLAFGNREGAIPFSSLMTAPVSDGELVTPVDPDALSLILYSSGTTGLPKGVMISQRNFVAQLVMGGPEGCSVIAKHDIMLATAMLTHVSGVWLCSLALSVGACIAVIAKLDLQAVLPAIERHRVTVLYVFPTVAQKIVESDLLEQHDVSTLKTFLVGGARTPPALAQKTIDTLGLESFRNLFGMTETCGAVTANPRSVLDSESIGVPVPLVKVKVIDVNTGKKLGPGQLGEIRVKGPCCSRGYINNEEATNELYDGEGFLKCGDIGYYNEEGTFYIVDRMKDLIKCMGQQIAPAELEDILLTHEAISEVVVVGVPHHEHGEAARAFMVLSEGYSVNAALETALRKLIEEQCAFHKQLHGGIEVVSNIPRSENGKYLRKALRDAFA